MDDLVGYELSDRLLRENGFDPPERAIRNLLRRYQAGNDRFRLLEGQSVPLVKLDVVEDFITTPPGKPHDAQRPLLETRICGQPFPDEEGAEIRD